MIPIEVKEEIQSNCSFQEAKLLLDNAIKDEIIVQFNKYNSFNRNIFTLTDVFNKIKPQIAFSEYSNIPSFVLKEVSKEKILSVRNKEDYSGFFLNMAIKHLKRDQKYIGLCWKESSTLKQISRLFNVKSLSISDEVNKVVENKYNLDTILKKSDIPKKHRLLSKIYNVNSPPLYYELQQKFGQKFVIQVNSSGGKGTYFINSNLDYKIVLKKIYSFFKVTEFIEGFSSNVSVLNVPRGNGCEVFIDIPSYKPMGIPSLNIRNTSSIGNTWSTVFNRADGIKFVDYINRVGKHLYENYGLVGLWGIDSIWTQEGFFINEINCRLQGTTEVSTINQFLSGYVPFYITHNLILLNQGITYMPNEEDYSTKLINTMTTKNRLSPFYFKKVSRKKLIPNKNYKGSGVYKLIDSGKLKFLFHSLNTLDANWDKGEVLLVDGPLSNTICEPGTKLLTIEGVYKTNHVFTQTGISKKMNNLNNAVDKLFQECEVEYEREINSF